MIPTLVSARLCWMSWLASSPLEALVAAVREAGSPRVAASELSSSRVITRFWSRGLFTPPPSNEGNPGVKKRK